MDQQLVLDTVTYLGMIIATVVVFSLIMWAAAVSCRASGRGRRCAAPLTVTVAVIGLPLWANLMDAVVPGQEFLGPWWWLAFIAVPAALSTAASLVILWQGPDRRWHPKEHLRAAIGALLCGFLGLVLVWQQTDNVWGWATAMSGCGPVEGTADWVSHREAYRRLWWGDPRAWFSTKCGAALDARMAADRSSKATPFPGLPADATESPPVSP